MTERVISWKAIAEFAQVRREATETKRSLAELNRQIQRNNAEEATSYAAAARNQQRLTQIREQAIRQSIAYREQALKASRADNDAVRVIQRLNNALNEEKRRLDIDGKSHRLNAQGVKNLVREKQRLDAISRNLRNSLIRETVASTNLQRAQNAMGAAERDVRAAIVDRDTAVRAANNAIRDHGQFSNEAAAALSRVRQTEEDLSRATDESARVARRAQRADEDLANVRSRVASGTRDVTNSVRRLRDEERAAVANGSILGRILAQLGGQAGGAGSGVKALAGAFSLMKIPLMVFGIIQLLSAISALGAGIIQLASEIGPAFSALAALPTIISAVGSAFAAIKLGFSGVGGALKAYTTGQGKAAIATGKTAGAQKSALQIMYQHRQNAQALASAEHTVEQAQYGVTQAQQNLNQARRDALQNIIDLKQAVVDAALAERGAGLSLEEARKNLQRILNDPGSTDLERRQAQLAVDEASNNLNKTKKDSIATRKEYHAAAKKGVEGANNVKQAQKAQADAVYSLRNAITQLKDAQINQKIQQQQQNQATAAGATAMDAFKEKMAGLTPAQRAMVRQLISMQKGWKGLKQAAAEGMGPGVVKGLHDVNGLFPILDRGMLQTGRAVGGVAAQIGGLTKTKNFRNNLRQMFAGNVPIIRALGSALTHVISIFVQMAVQAQPFTLWMARVIEGWAKMGDHAMKASGHTGRLAAYLNNVVKPTLQVLGSILHNIAVGLSIMGHSARTTQDSLLTSIKNITARWVAWERTVKGQNAMRDYFDNARATLRQLDALLGSVFRWMGRLAASANSAGFFKQLRTELGPALGKMFNAFNGNFGSSLVDFLTSLANIITKLTANSTGVISIFVAGMSDLAKALEKILQYPGVITVLGGIVTALAAFKAVKLISTVTGIRALVRALAALRSGQAAEGAGGLAKLFARWRRSVPEGGSLFGALGTKIKSGWRTVTTAIGLGGLRIKSAFGRIGKGLKGAASGVAGGVGKAFGAIRARISGDRGELNFGPLIARFKQLGSRIADLGRGIGSRLRGALVAGGAAVSRFAGAVKGAAVATGRWIGANIRLLAQQVVARARIIATAIATNAQRVASLAIAAATKIWAGIQIVFNLIMSANPVFLIIAAVAALIAVIVWLNSKFHFLMPTIRAVGAAFTWLWQNVIKPVGKWIVGAAEAVWHGIVNAFTFLWGWIKKIFAVWWGAVKLIYWTPIKWIIDHAGAIWDAIKTAFTVGWNWVKKIFGVWWGAVKLIYWTPIKWIIDHAGDVWDAIKTAFTVGWNWVKNVFGSIWDGIKAVFWTPIKWVIDHIGGWFSSIGSAISNALGKIGDVISGIWDGITNVLTGGINGIIDVLNFFIGAVNWILGKLPGGLHIPPIPSIGKTPKHHGSSGHGSGGGSTGRRAVGASKGAVVPGYAPGYDSEHYLLSPGEGVLVPEAVRGLGAGFVHWANAFYSRGRAGGTPVPGRMAKGGIAGKPGKPIHPGLPGWALHGHGGFLDALGGAFGKGLSTVGGFIRSGLAWALRKGLDVAEAPVRGAVHLLPKGFARDLGQGGYNKLDHVLRGLIDSLGGKARDTIKSGVRFAGGPVPPGTVLDWARQAVAIAGFPLSWVPAIGRRAMFESSGNPRAINLTDINAQEGHPSKGLMQTIDSTFNAYAMRGHGNIWNPVDNIIAAIRYIQKNYGSIFAIDPPVQGYAAGGRVHGTGDRDTVHAKLTPGEYVIRKRAAKRIGLDNLDAMNRMEHFHDGGPVGGVKPGASQPAISALKWQLGIGGPTPSPAWTSALTRAFKGGQFPYTHPVSLSMAQSLLELMKKHRQSGYSRISRLARWPEYQAEEVFTHYLDWFRMKMADSTKSVLEGQVIHGPHKGQWERVMLATRGKAKGKPVLKDAKGKDLYSSTRHTTVPVDPPWRTKNPLHFEYETMIGERSRVGSFMRALQRRLGLRTTGQWNPGMTLPAKHLMYHGMNKAHPWTWPHPWSGPVTSVEEAIAEQGRANALQTEWNGYLTTFSTWGLKDLVQWLEDKGVADGMEIARSASKSRGAAAALDTQIKQSNNLTGTITTANGVQFDQAEILKAIATLAGGSITNQVGIRGLATSLQVPDYVVVNMFDVLMQRIGRTIDPRKLGKLQNDVTLFRQGLFYAATGGSVPGVGSTDKVPSMLTPGEYVIRSRAARALGPEALDRLNHFDAFQHFALGGLVRPTVNASVPRMGRAAAGAVSYTENNEIKIINPSISDGTYSLTKAMQLKAATGKWNRTPQQYRFLGQEPRG